MDSATAISTIVEISEPLHNSLTQFLDARPDWDQIRVIEAAIALFLLQNSPSRDLEISRAYLDAIFKRPVETL
jgi:hypothetical protein